MSNLRFPSFPDFRETDSRSESIYSKQECYLLVLDFDLRGGLIFHFTKVHFPVFNSRHDYVLLFVLGFVLIGTFRF